MDGEGVLFRTDRFRPSTPAVEASRKFILEPWREINFDGREEWAIKRILPRTGLAAIYGKPGSFKSFIACHVALCLAVDWPWAGRRVSKTLVIYIAAEGAAGLRKRKAGYVKAHPDLPPDLPFFLIAAAPNLGTDPGDLEELIATIEASGYRPGLIVLDTAAQTLRSADENGPGMTALIANANILARHFNALVLLVHHVGLGDDKRMRGHSSLNGAVDAQILCQLKEGELAATLTLQKLKDDASDIKLVAQLSRIVIGHDEDGEEISTLIVDSIEEAELAASTPSTKSVPPQQRLLMTVVKEAIVEAGETFNPFGDGPQVRGVADNVVRARYYSRIAEQAAPDEDRKKLAERQRKAFNTAVINTLKAERLVAKEHNGRRFLWLP
jgi:hypothetical protein